MSKTKLSIRNNHGQILVEAIVVSLLMVVVMLAFQKLIDLKNNQTKPFGNVYKKLNELNQSTK